MKTIRSTFLILLLLGAMLLSYGLASANSVDLKAGSGQAALGGIGSSVTVSGAGGSGLLSPQGSVRGGG